ncbi:hypothetical protein HZS_6553 [Henneguya salminicola]|nr:hypothetical protein HZS_6553 [Henneguya salminicola]
MDALLEIFLLDHGVLESDRKCSKCRNPMKIDLTTKLWRCSHDSCRKQSSLLKNFFFETCKVPLNKILQLSNLFLMVMLVEATTLSYRTFTS